MDLPELARDASGKAETKARQLLSWLPDPKRCDECGQFCEAGVTWDPRMVEYTDAWVCPNEECGAEYYRERY